MGIYLNPGNDLFYSTVTYSEIYVDKTMLISFTNKCLFGENKEICVSRPRRFGKSMAENMLTAYYSKGCDSRELFSKFQIAQTPDFEKHLNRYNVIHIDIQQFISKYPVIQEIKDLMESNGARKAMMSGSGPTVFGIFDDKEKMERAAAVLRESRFAKTVFATDVF